MKKWMGLFLILTLVGCGSSEKKSPPTNAPDVSSTEGGKDPWEAEPDVPASTVNDAAPVSTNGEGKATVYENLDRAIKAQKDDEIFRSASTLLMQYPSDVKALNALALYNYKKGRFEAAKYLLHKAIQVMPASNESHVNLGVVYLATQDRHEAIASFKRALQIKPKDNKASANLGSIFVQDKNYRKALAFLETAVGNGNNDFRVLNNYGIALVATGDFKKAEEIYELGLQDKSQSKELLLNYSILLVDHLKKYQKASELIEKIRSSGVDTEMRSKMQGLENKIKAGS